MTKNTKKILIILLFMLMTLMLLTKQTNAAFLEEKYFSKTSPYSGTFSLIYNDLISNSNWNMLCSEYGQHIPSNNNIQNAYSGSSNSYNSMFNSVEWLNSYSSTSKTNEYSGKYYHSDKEAYYVIQSTHIATPRQALILSYMQEGVNSYTSPSDYTDIQKAWYNTLGGSFSTTLYTISTSYQNFIKKLAINPSNVDKTSTYVEKSHVFSDGRTANIMFPDLDEEKIKSSVSFNNVDSSNNKVEKAKNSWASNVTVNYNEQTQKYLIGPFSLNYIEASSNGVDFGAICGFDIYTNANEKPVSNEDWKFVWIDGQRASDDQFVYPHANEVFYIELNYIENATMITGMDIDYRYLIAGAEYQTLAGTYDQYNWKIKCDKGEDESGNKTYKWYFEAKQQGLALKSQTLSLADSAARWYETVKIERKSNQADLKITKIALDENGNEVTADQIKEKFGEYQYFDFRVTVTHSTGEKEYFDTTARAGSSVLVGPISWDEKETTPTYTVEEIPSSSSEWSFKSITNESGSLQVGKTVEVTAINEITKEHHNKFRIDKTISGIADGDESFKFDITVTFADNSQRKTTAEILVKKGETTASWESEEYFWYGENAPTYEIIELETEASKKYSAYINPSKGSLGDYNETGSKIIINALNNEKSTSKEGKLVIEKQLSENQVTSDTFDFRIVVKGDGLKGTTNGEIAFDVLGVKAGEKIGPYIFAWEGDTAPTYTVEEINVNNDEEKVSKIEATYENGTSAGKQEGNKVTGQLASDGTAQINIKFTNNMTEHKGGLKIIKDIYSTEKISKETVAEEGTKFNIEVVISGTFIYDGKAYQNTTKVINKTLPNDGKWSFEISDIKWYGEKAPTYTVREIDLPTGWITRSITYSDLDDKTDIESHSLIADKTVDVTIVNELPPTTVIDLTFSMAGVVWVDKILDGKNTDEYYNKPNGVYDEGETLKENAEVNVYKVIYDASGNEIARELAQAFKDTAGNEIIYPIITKSDGKWDIQRINVPAVSEDEKAKGYIARYDVEFKYDGQTYEPTEFLAYQVKSDGTKTKNDGTNSEKAVAYKTAKTSVRDRYAKDSMALSIGENANNVITEVYGKSEIDANGDTTGYAKLANGNTVEINYHSDNGGNGYPVQSKLVTTGKNGLVLDVFKSTARTSVGSLVFPFDGDADGMSLTNVDKKITEAGLQTTYKYTAVYNHCLNINLGLMERSTSDIGLTKKLSDAKVIVKEKLYQYNYSGHYDLTQEKISALDQDIKVASAEDIEFKLGLYKSDYYYRAEIYSNKEDMYTGLTNFYSTINKKLDDTEMDIYLTYILKLQNNSSIYDAKINSINDYYETSLSLVTSDETKYLKTQTVAGKEENVNALVKVASASDYANNWSIVKSGIIGADKDKNDTNITYNKMTLNNLNIILAPGDTKDITVTFKVNKANDKNYNIEDSIILGLKNNVAEISNYSTLYTGTNNYAGKVDRDSAPDNINIYAFNSKKWYEDDTFAAPKLNIDLVGVNQERTINGIVWEDNSNNKNTENPDDRYNQQVGDGIKQDDEQTIDNLSTVLVEKVMVPAENGKYIEYDYTWPTSQKLDCLNGKTIEEVCGLNSVITTSNGGKYTFNAVAAGDYVVRFTYGNDSNNKIKSANYSTAQYYNGQDYKSTALKADMKGEMSNGYIVADQYMDLDATNKNNIIKNTALDNEVRRLQVVEKSRTIDYNNGVVMAEYQDNLFKDYYMFADTLKLDMNIEFAGYGNDDYTYAVNNVNFGLEERPITKLTLDKQIEEITLTTSDGNTIMKASYDINYNINENGEIVAKVELNNQKSYGTDNLMALNRDLATNQGFRYINIDNDILEGTTISVKYRFTVLNTGEVDRTGLLADDKNYTWDESGFNKVCEDLSAKFATYTKSGNSLVNNNEIGHYVGSIYYLGVNGSKEDKVVASKVRQLVDYIDTDVIFDGVTNSVANMSWRNSTSTELKELINSELVTTVDGKDVILDKDGVQYETENRNNIAVSVDSDDITKTVNNGEFIIDLVPYIATTSTGIPCNSSMYLTTTKYVGADSDDLQIDNIAEIIKYENIVGRRDELTVPGNQDPAKALETINTIGRPTTGSIADNAMKYERDTSVTEVITLSPPTGTELTTWKLQILAVTTVALILLGSGIIVIKKKVLLK